MQHDAVSRCADGALQAVRGSHFVAAELELIAALPGEVVGSPRKLATLMFFNDRKDTTHADVMALFDRAIAKCEADAEWAYQQATVAAPAEQQIKTAAR